MDEGTEGARSVSLPRAPPAFDGRAGLVPRGRGRRRYVDGSGVAEGRGDDSPDPRHCTPTPNVRERHAGDPGHGHSLACRPTSIGKRDRRGFSSRPTSLSRESLREHPRIAPTLACGASRWSGWVFGAHFKLWGQAPVMTRPCPAFFPVRPASDIPGNNRKPGCSRGAFEGGRSGARLVQ